MTDPKSLDLFVWERPQAIDSLLDDGLHTLSNPLSLAFKEEALLLACRAAAIDLVGTITVAFTVAGDIMEELKDRFGPSYFEETYSDVASNLKHWEFLGYDVVDSWLSHSGIFGCGAKMWSSEIRGKLGRKLNMYGLFAEITDAASFAKIVDSVIPEHFPFSPLGVFQLRKPTVTITGTD